MASSCFMCPDLYLCLAGSQRLSPSFLEFEGLPRFHRCYGRKLGLGTTTAVTGVATQPDSNIISSTLSLYRVRPHPLSFHTPKFIHSIVPPPSCSCDGVMLMVFNPGTLMRARSGPVQRITCEETACPKPRAKIHLHNESGHEIANSRALKQPDPWRICIRGTHTARSPAATSARVAWSAHCTARTPSE